MRLHGNTSSSSLESKVVLRLDYHIHIYKSFANINPIKTAQKLGKKKDTVLNEIDLRRNFSLHPSNTQYTIHEKALPNSRIYSGLELYTFQFHNLPKDFPFLLLSLPSYKQPCKEHLV